MVYLFKIVGKLHPSFDSFTGWQIDLAMITKSLFYCSLRVFPTHLPHTCLSIDTWVGRPAVDQTRGFSFCSLDCLLRPLLFDLCIQRFRMWSKNPLFKKSSIVHNSFQIKTISIARTHTNIPYKGLSQSSKYEQMFGEYGQMSAETFAKVFTSHACLEEHLGVCQSVTHTCHIMRHIIVLQQAHYCIYTSRNKSYRW